MVRQILKNKNNEKHIEISENILEAISTSNLLTMLILLFFIMFVLIVTYVVLDKGIVNYIYRLEGITTDVEKLLENFDGMVTKGNNIGEKGILLLDNLNGTFSSISSPITGVKSSIQSLIDYIKGLVGGGTTA